jgi:pseudaminic acid synthase
VPAYKIASFEITDIPLIAYVASKGKPVIISTGIAGIEDIELALKTCRDAGARDITLLQCTSAYPAAPEDANLLTIPDLRARFGVNVGLSDHTMGIEAPVVAVSLGAKVIEKHFILNKSVGGPDAHFSLDEQEFTNMVRAVRIAEKMLGKADYSLNEKKLKSREFSRSLYVTEDVKKGEVFSEKNVRSVRPGFGLHTKYFTELMGKRAAFDLTKGTALKWEMITDIKA